MANPRVSDKEKQTEAFAVNATFIRNRCGGWSKIRGIRLCNLINRLCSVDLEKVFHNLGLWDVLIILTF